MPNPNLSHVSDIAQACSRADEALVHDLVTRCDQNTYAAVVLNRALAHDTHAVRALLRVRPTDIATRQTIVDLLCVMDLSRGSRQLSATLRVVVDGAADKLVWSAAHLPLACVLLVNPRYDSWAKPAAVSNDDWGNIAPIITAAQHTPQSPHWVRFVEDIRHFGDPHPALWSSVPLKHIWAGPYASVLLDTASVVWDRASPSADGRSVRTEVFDLLRTSCPGLMSAVALGHIPETSDPLKNTRAVISLLEGHPGWIDDLDQESASKMLTLWDKAILSTTKTPEPAHHQLRAQIQARLLSVALDPSAVSPDRRALKM